MSPLRVLMLLCALVATSAFTLTPSVPARAVAAASTTLEGVTMGRGDKRTAKGESPSPLLALCVLFVVKSQVARFAC